MTDGAGIAFEPVDDGFTAATSGVTHGANEFGVVVWLLLGRRIGSLRYGATGLTLMLFSGESVRITERAHLEGAKKALDRAIGTIAAE